MIHTKSMSLPTEKKSETAPTLHATEWARTLLKQPISQLSLSTLRGLAIPLTALPQKNAHNRLGNCTPRGLKSPSKSVLC